MSRPCAAGTPRGSSSGEPDLSTFAELLAARSDDDRPGFLCGDLVWSYRQVVAEGRARAALFAERRRPDRPPHIGVLLDNGPEYLAWLVGAALSGAVVVGINATYRGSALAQLVEHTDCQLLVTSSSFEAVLAGSALDLPTLVVDRGSGLELPDPVPEVAVAEEDLLLLIFTSGSTGAPKAVRCTQGRLARTGGHVARVAQLGPGDVVYSPLPFFHSSSLFTGWSSSVAAGVPFSSRPRFSASNVLPDVRSFGATMLTYTGKVLNYILATPERPDDADTPLRLAIGNEASARDIAEFARRFACTVRDSYGATEGIIVIRREPSMPAGALGRAEPSVKVLDPETGQECPPALFGPDGRVTNLELAVGEIVETAPETVFEGYYNNVEATSSRFRDGCYWSGDLAYRDQEGWLYFAGRTDDWLRVDGENFAAAPVEAILARHPDVRSVAVFAVPDDPVGDRVMAALELSPRRSFDPEEFDHFLDAQTDLGTKWRPAFVRVMSEIPKLASMKLDKRRLRAEGWAQGQVFWRPARTEGLRPLTAEDRAALSHLRP